MESKAYTDDEWEFIVCSYCNVVIDNSEVTSEEWEQITENSRTPMCLDCKIEIEESHRRKS
jgi:hypothetical protein